MDDVQEAATVDEIHTTSSFRLPNKKNGHVAHQELGAQFLADQTIIQLPLFPIANVTNSAQPSLLPETVVPPPELFEDLWGNPLSPSADVLNGKEAERGIETEDGISVFPPTPQFPSFSTAVYIDDDPLAGHTDNGQVKDRESEYVAYPQTDQILYDDVLPFSSETDFADLDQEIRVGDVETTIEDIDFDELLLLDIDDALSAMQEETEEEHFHQSLSDLQNRQSVLLPGRGNIAGWNGSIGLFYINWERGEVAEAEALKRLGYGELEISDATRDFILQAARAAHLPHWEEKKLTERRAILRASLSALPPIEEDCNDPYASERSAFATEIRTIEQTLVLKMQWVAVKKSTRFLGRGIDLEDLIQYGMQGVISGVRKFDITRQARLLMAVNTWVFQALNRAVGDYGQQIRLPVYVVEERRKIKKHYYHLCSSLNRFPTRLELADVAQIPLAELEEMLTVRKRCISLEKYKQAEYLNEGYSFQPVENAFIDQQMILERLARIADRSEIDALMLILRLRERNILSLRFGLSDDEGAEEQTLEEVGQQYNLTRERVRQLEKKALERMLEHLQGQEN